MSKVYITRGDGLRARRQPTTDATIVGDFPAGSRLAVDHNVTVGSDIWHALPVTAGDFPLRDASNSMYPAYLFAAHRYRGTDYTDAEVVAPPVSTRPPYRIGVHVIGNMGAADRAIAAGTKVIFAMHEHLGIHQRALANPHITFIYRGWVEGRPTPLDVLHHLQVGRDNPPNLWYVGLNENDHYGDDPDALRFRAKWDGELFHRLKDIRSDIRYFGLSLGHGCPARLEDPNGPVTAALMDFAPLWNEGMGIDLHNYTKGKRFADDPPGDALIIDPIWFEDRGQWWFRNGILDPRKGGGFLHGETGVEAGHGGYNWAGYSGPQFARHIRTLRDFGRAPIVVDSGPYKGTWPSVDVAGAIFQMGDTRTESGGWSGHNVERYLPELRTFWAEGG